MRVKNVAKNSFFSIFCQLIIIVMGFFSQRVINLQLGKELVGMNGVIANVIAIFSVSELGLSTAVTYHLYRALVNYSEREIAGLMNLYRKSYRIVALVISFLGICFLPFLHLVMKENHFTVSFIRTVYALWLIKTVAGYLLSYKRAIIIADQREYLSSLATMAASVFNYLSVIVLVLLTKDYVLALSLSIVFELLVNYALAVYVDKSYPFLRVYARQKIEPAVVKHVFRDIKSIFVTRISQKLLGSTDNLIMSGFVSVGLVGLYSNYCLITQALMNILQALANSLQPTFGNLAVDGNKKKDYEMLRMVSLLYFFISAITISGYLALATPFVTDVWLGKDFALGDRTILICAVNCIVQILAMPISLFLNVSGLFRDEKKVSMTSAVANLIFSLALVRVFGIDGVLLGTFFAYLIQLFGKILYYFQGYLERPLIPFVLTVIFYLLLGTAEVLGCRWICSLMYRPGNWAAFALCAALCVLLPGAVNGLLFWRTESMRQLVKILRNYVGGKRNEK